MFLSIRKWFALMLMVCVSALASAEAPRTFDQIINSGSLRIGVSVFPPWVMRGKDGQLIGAEIDMGRRLAADMGLKPEFGEYEWKQLIPALNNGEIDIIVSGMGIKPNRALKVNFSRPYGDAGIGLVANTAKTKDISGLDDLKNPKIKIAVVEGTVSHDLAKRMFGKATLVTVATEDAVEKALLSGDVHFAIAPNPLPRFLALRHRGKVDEPLTAPLLSFKEGMAINKSDVDFLNFIDSWVVSRIADGWIPSTRQYWLESLDWQELVK